MENSKGVDTPAVKYSKVQEEQAQEWLTAEYTPFRSKLGKLMAISHDRADIQFATMTIAKHAARPTS